jgi:hypothetical protein
MGITFLKKYLQVWVPIPAGDTRAAPYQGTHQPPALALKENELLKYLMIKEEHRPTKPTGEDQYRFLFPINDWMGTLGHFDAAGLFQTHH